MNRKQLEEDLKAFYECEESHKMVDLSWNLLRHGIERKGEIVDSRRAQSEKATGSEVLVVVGI